MTKGKLNGDKGTPNPSIAPLIKSLFLLRSQNLPNSGVCSVHSNLQLTYFFGGLDNSLVGVEGAQPMWKIMS